MAKKNVWTLTIAAGALAAAQIIRANRRRFPVRGKVVLVTGSSRGLGLALAERYARAGACVVLTARDASELQQAKHLLVERGATAPGSLLTIPCDLRDQEEVRHLMGEISRHWGDIDVLVNNAGVISVGPVESQPLEAYRDSMESNFFSMLHTTLAVLPAMLARGHGSIVNITSIGGKVAVPHLLPYSASKFAAVGFSEGLHAEVRSKGVRVTTVTPGLLRTGSPVHALFVGDREREFRWFNLGASLPGVSRDAYAAAGRILRATETGETEFSITPQAALAARVAPLAPAITAAVLSLVNESLPGARPGQKQPRPGSSSTKRDIRPLTGSGRAAERRWNELHGK